MLKDPPVVAKLGHTTYSMEDDTTPGQVKITRTNERIAELWIPRALVVQYFAAKLSRVVTAEILAVLDKV
jgi:hypothetical protein